MKDEDGAWVKPSGVPEDRAAGYPCIDKRLMMLFKPPRCNDIVVNVKRRRVSVRIPILIWIGLKPAGGMERVGDNCRCERGQGVGGWGGCRRDLEALRARSADRRTEWNPFWAE